LDDAELVITEDEMRGLDAVARARQARGADAVPSRVLARTLFREALDAQLEQVDLPWAPEPDEVTARLDAMAPRAGSTWLASARHNRAFVRSFQAVLVIATVLVLVGGYGGGWAWTGFRDNRQLWDWLQLALLPLALGVLPLWLRHADRIDRRRRVALVAAVVAFGVFVVVGYLDPLGWTGFRGNKLWDWLVLVLLPITLIAVPTWSRSRRQAGLGLQAVVGVLALGWLVSVIGGYEWGWSWTGYEGNSLWDWLQLLLAPIVLPIIVVPALGELATGNVGRQIRDERLRAVHASVDSAPPLS
jgi:hypothetical protein